MKRRRTKWYRRCLPSVLFLILCAGLLFWLGWLLVQPWTEPPGDPAPESESTSHMIIITPTPGPMDPEEALVQAVMTRDDEAGG